jgi:hypothetical protein
MNDAVTQEHDQKILDTIAFMPLLLERLSPSDAVVILECLPERIRLALIISRVNSPPLGAHEKSKKELQYPAACGGAVYLIGLLKLIIRLRLFWRWRSLLFWILRRWVLLIVNQDEANKY